MRNLSLVLNGVLLVAVAILFYLHFSNNGNNTAISPTKPVEDTTAVSNPKVEQLLTGKVGYINIDSLQMNYKLYKELMKKLEVKQKQYEQSIQSKTKKLEEKVIAFQKNAQNLSQFEGQLQQKKLMEEEQKLYELQDSYVQKFGEEEKKLNDKFQKTVKDYIANFNENENYDIILGASKLGCIVLDFNKEIDITKTLTQGLNQQYDIENSAEK